MTLEWDSGLLKIAEVFRRAGAEAYIVGGTVRNRLLGLPMGDIDIAGPLSADEAIAVLCEIPGVKARVKQRELGTVGATVAGYDVEYTPFRTESYSQGHRPTEVRFGATLKQDALRRDFTVNAIYAPISGGEIVDPLGGICDLQRKVLRAARPNPEETLRDDGLRLLRLCRFAAELRFSAEPCTLEAAKTHCRIIDDIANERIMAEIARLLLADGHYAGIPFGGTAEGLRLMRDIGLWQRLLPQLPAPDGALFAAISDLPSTLPVRLVALGYNKEEHALHKTLQKLCFSGANMAKAREVHQAAKSPQAVEPAHISLARTQFSDDAIEDAWRLRVAFGDMDLDKHDHLAATLHKLQKDRVPRAITDLAITGNDLLKMGYSAGPQLGRTLNELLRRCAIGEAANEFETLTRIAAELLKSECK